VKVASFFAGVGGIDLGFEKAGFDVIFSNEIDSKAVETLKLNFQNSYIIHDSISNLKDIPDVDIITGGFPCQAFSLAGHKKGFDDERGKIVFELLDIIKKKKPKIIFLENVKNLLGHDNGNSFGTILEILEKQGYYIKYKVMKASDYTKIPQARERLYIIGFRDKKAFLRFSFPDMVLKTDKLENFIDYENKLEPIFYYSKEKNVFFSSLEENMKNSKSIYQ